MDGTLLHLFLPEDQRKQQRWRSRHGAAQQNVFAAVYFDKTFAYVLAGAEGSMHDNGLIQEALGRTFRLPTGRYFLEDSGLGRRRGLLTPYPGVFYHQEEKREAGVPPASEKELYNTMHASNRVIVENAFGIVKCMFKIVRIALAEYIIGVQTDLYLRLLWSVELFIV